MTERSSTRSQSARSLAKQAGFDLFKTDPFIQDQVLMKENLKGRSVSKVKDDTSGKVYARKEYIQWNHGNDKLVKMIKEEASTITKARHHHIVKCHGYHYIENTGLFGLLIRPVAEKNLKEFFGQIEAGRGQDTQDSNRGIMCKWVVCLFDALGYLHREKIRHKDIKPSNILIKGDQIYVADFGISRNFRDATTSKTKSQDPERTERYMAPEIDCDERRGRATDVWALGCTVLEICTVASGNTIEELNEHLRQHGRHILFCDTPYYVFDWMLLLLASPGLNPNVAPHIQKIVQLTFLMLDPKQKKRITMEQLLHLLGTEDFKSIASLACSTCQSTRSYRRQGLSHSTFNKAYGGGICIPSKNGISKHTPNLWETIKGRWLSQHMWW
ncbi:Leucine-rich repeat receptor-like protein kinase PEPR1 [Daldinia childiae]|uniref:Leucine-rich repeat receptor-like protein kinase PEPR1 n=1 Tax=Daldinia childiae TaxID=326645 RepID=UPI00144772BA|nr:Leucine-rich repeat receptor-like protein kinase PEPR1 [Daldinia childiae]KAF3066337.1 Leucine-rich repeat receptor-like protein kinase PEPR1 [Daldinia childiae]